MSSRTLTVIIFTLLVISSVLIISYGIFKKHNEWQMFEASKSGEFKKLALSILRSKTYVNKKDKYGFTPIMYAANMGNYTTFRFLFNMKADITVETKDGEGLLLLAAGSKQNVIPSPYSDKDRALIIHLLLSRGMDINVESSIGRMPLSYASGCGYTETVYFLLNNRSIVNNIDKKGYSALSLAIQNEHPIVSRILLENGALLKELL